MALRDRLRRLIGASVSSDARGAGAPDAIPDRRDVYDTPLSPEADAFLTSCNESFNARQERLTSEWLSDYDSYRVDMEAGRLELTRNEAVISTFRVSALGSYHRQEGTWEWAWNNPHVPPEIAVPKATFEEPAVRYGLRYLSFGMFPAFDEQFGWYLGGIAMKLTGALGVYEAEAGDLAIYLLLFDPRRSDS